MDQDVTWYGGRPRPRRLCVRSGPAPPPQKGERSPPQVYCDQTAGWMKLVLGMEVGLGPGHIVLDEDPAPLSKRGQIVQFSAHFLLWPNGWMHQDATWYGGRPLPRRLCVRWGHSCPQKRRAHAPHPIFGPCLLWPNGWMDEDATWYGCRPRPRPLCIRLVPSYPRKGHSNPPLFGPCLLWPRSPISATAELLLKILFCEFRYRNVIEQSEQMSYLNYRE